MITTSTGAKKLESSDNWREIFPNPGTSAAGAHNASVDAQDRIQAEVAPIINGKRCSLGAASGDYVLLRNSTITGKSDGAYIATKAIPANTDIDSTYLGNPITGGMVNELNSNITTLISKMGYGTDLTEIELPYTFQGHKLYRQVIDVSNSDTATANTWKVLRSGLSLTGFSILKIYAVLVSGGYMYSGMPCYATDSAIAVFNNTGGDIPYNVGSFAIIEYIK